MTVFVNMPLNGRHIELALLSVHKPATSILHVKRPLVGLSALIGPGDYRKNPSVSGKATTGSKAGLAQANNQNTMTLNTSPKLSIEHCQYGTMRNQSPIFY